MVKTVLGPGGAALINSGAWFLSCSLYTFTLTGGGVIRLTTSDFNVFDLSGNRYHSGRIGSGFPKIDLKSSRVQGKWRRGLDSDSWTVVIIPQIIDPFSGVYSYPDAIGTIPWLTACRVGLFDEAQVQVDRGYFANPIQPPLTQALATPAAIVPKIFFGVVGQVDIVAQTSVFTLNEYKSRMTQLMPRNLYQKECRHQLFDSGCTLNAASFAVNGTVGGGSTQTNIVASPAPPAGSSGTWLLGRIVMTSGKNNGFQRLVTSWDGVTNIGLLQPLPFAPTPGDTFTIYPGCDKSTGSQGCGGFNNLPNFGGTPNVPTPDIILG